jgi:hypothetical protein
MQILVFVDAISNRLQYIFSHILGEMLGFEVVFTQRNGDFDHFIGPKIAYSSTKFHNSISIVPHSLLFQEGISNQSVVISNWNSTPIFFETDKNADIPFDLFSAAFFLISRYEEYLPFDKDLHGRFQSANSITYRYGFLDIPVVDIWVNRLAEIIKHRFPGVAIKDKGFSFIPTIDIDNAYAYKHKGIMRSLLGTANSLAHLRFSDLFRRIGVLCNFMPDPFDTYAKLFEQFENTPQALWFILCGVNGKFDRNISLTAKPMQRLLKQIAKRFEVGIHPSYASGISKVHVRSELKSLSQVVGKTITASRQHYLRITLPETYRLLSELGLTHDYSMGYSDKIGFRAGTCTSFRFYDLMDEKVLPLTIVPFQVMDRALLYGLQLNPDEAIDKTLEMANSIKQVGGKFVTVWHNESLSGLNEWVGWKDVFGEIVKKINKFKL